jgi:hypothetical protein
MDVRQLPQKDVRQDVRAKKDVREMKDVRDIRQSKDVRAMKVDVRAGKPLVDVRSIPR